MLVPGGYVFSEGVSSGVGFSPTEAVDVERFWTKVTCLRNTWWIIPVSK